MTAPDAHHPDNRAIAPMSKRKRWTRRSVFAIAATATVVSLAAAVASGCSTRQCTQGSSNYDGGRMLNLSTYETNDWNERWIPYPGNVTVNVRFPASNTRQPISVQGYVGTSDTPNGGVDFQGGQNWAPTAGQLQESFFFSTTGLSVFNNSCADYFARFVVNFAPPTFTVFGGAVSPGTDAGSALLGDTWTWDGTEWTEGQVVSNANPALSPRTGAAIATINAGQFLLGGFEESTTPDGSIVTQSGNDFWSWDGVTWTQRFWQCPPADSGLPCIPEPRSGGAMAALLDHATADGGTANEIVLFGGDVAGAVIPPTTWVWDGVVWAERFPSGPVPPARTMAAAAGLEGRAVLFGGKPATTGNGGSDGGLTPLGDTWVYDDTSVSWTQVSPAHSPSPRFGASATTFGDRIVLFGGNDGTQDLNDTWTWDGTDWTQISGASNAGNTDGGTSDGAPSDGAPSDGAPSDGEPSATGTIEAPPPRAGAAIGVFGAGAGDAVLLFGGFSGSTPLADFWSWNGSAWQPIVATGATPPPRGAAAAGGL
jgi:hypothetical protein